MDVFLIVATACPDKFSNRIDNTVLYIRIMMAHDSTVLNSASIGNSRNLASP